MPILPSLRPTLTEFQALEAEAATHLDELSDDTSPQLGGDLDTNENSITSANGSPGGGDPGEAGKDVTITTGSGGTSTSDDGGDGGTLFLSSGSGGVSLGETGGDGGPVQIQAGAGGNGGSGNGGYGDVHIQPTGGNVGIGNTSPTEKLDVTGNIRANAVRFNDATGIEDDSGNQQIIFQKTDSAVNHIDLTNAATGNGPSIQAVGDDTNVDLNINSKGTGQVKINGIAIPLAQGFGA